VTPSDGSAPHATILLIRHAHAVWTPDEARPLSEQGRADARKLANGLAYLQVDAVYSSPATRAVQTVEPIAAEKKLPVRVVDDLRERMLSGEPVDDFDAAVRAVWDDAHFAWPGGESNRAAQRRGVASVEAIVAAHPGECVVIGTHGNLLALILQHYDPALEER
jgi:2,3-bisphosphoglycerate-dependent phosphoglycerate mutase